MYEKEVTITAEHGIHTRPAALVVKKARSFPCEIWVQCNGKEVSAKSLFKLQTLGLYKGVSVKVIAKGEQAQQAVQEVSELIITLS
ncbi:MULTISPECIES: HPr family phosphocarrier protein [Shewanella]|uniref:Phosphocarrier protein HPr n=1 Tax=Shewanella fidelis TaxID=173509 RepID=A0AAW8NPW0_9GAMM|nr:MULTISPECIES: HPr family phosphocarrier protein [Shewanella]MDR8523953.1 HPr family phosphocarrier protein [Shewanella fidelis]MDW4810500.1 HPr family phosphocarrier protein [Shewanella fidelis]MDW4814621.1 HPr family phosphocarrier protein [Shewanella fidelis]MDW4818711.1 HPr family phosphocarrier protein [Shewanella fidelis]MDW4823612.1 HPr family phosphocarrier protein [Shewanella fidelis]